MKRRLRRATSFVLALIMLTSMVGIVNVLAVTDSAWQIEKFGENTAYHTLDNHGVSTATGTDPVNSYSNGGSSVTVSKTITPSATQENQFTIDLEVVTTEDIQDVELTADAAVVLVIDASASMWSNIAGEGAVWKNGQWTTSIPAAEQRLTMAKAAAIKFVKDFAADAGEAKRMVSVVTFNTGSATVLDWTDAAGLDWTADSNAITTAINGIGIDSNTNVYAGLSSANSLLDTVNTAAGKEIKSTYVVLVSDGGPNDPDSPYGDNRSDEQYAADMASAMAVTIKNKGAVLYTVAFAASGDTCYTTQGGYRETTHSCTTAGWHRHDADERRDNGYGNGKTGALSYGRFTECDHWFYCSCESGWFNGAHTGTTREWVPGSSVTVGSWLSGIASSTGHYIDAASGQELTIGLTDIVNRIKQLASAWQVTDPMGRFITLDKSSITGSNNVTLSEAGNTITWNLKADDVRGVEAEGVTTYTYHLRYNIALDTAAQGFEEETYYPTNGYTKLEYYFIEEVLDADGNIITSDTSPVRTIDFKVPAVKGTIPLVDYTVEHYWLGRDLNQETAALHESETIRDVQLWSDQTISAKDYSASNYSYKQGDAALQTIECDGQTFKLYYAPVTTAVTVNHYYKDTTIDAAGNPTTTEYALRHTTMDGTGTTGEPNAKLYAGDDYTMGASGNLGFITTDGYGVDAVKNSADKKLNNNTLKLTSAAANNVINVYYSRTTDNSEASVTVTHTYDTYGWVLDNDPTSATYGRYVERRVSTSTVPAESSTRIMLAQQSSYAASLNPIEGYEAFGFISASSTTDDSVTVNPEAKTAVIDLRVGSNDLNLVFEKRGERPAAVSFTVEHIYSKSVTAVVNGQISHEGSFSNQLGTTETIDTYAAGERYSLAPITTYLEEGGFSLSESEQAKLTGTVESGKTIKLYYTKSVTPDPATLTVIHVYRDWETYTIPEAEGGDGIQTGLRQIESTIPNATVNYPTAGGTLYAGQNVPVGLVGQDGYIFNDADSDISAAGENVAAQNQTIYVYYDKTVNDARDDASVTVIHHYATLLDTVVGGVVTDGYVVDNGSYTEAAQTGRAGDPWSTSARTAHTLADGVTTYDDYTLDNVRSGALSGTMVGDQTIDLYYTRTASDRTNATYNVVYEYYVQEMTFNDQGVAGYWTAPVKLETNPAGAPADITGAAAYLDQTVSLVSGAGSFDGKTFTLKSDSAPDTAATITADGQTITLKYLCQTPKTPTTVTVTHHYITTTYDPANIPGTPVDRPSEPVTYHVFAGESFTAEAVIAPLFSYQKVEDSANIVTASQNEETKDYTITVPETASTIDFYYTYDDTSAVTPATWKVEHWYRTLYWNDPADKAYEMATPAQSGSSYATRTLTGEPDLKVDSNSNPTYSLDRAESAPGAFAEGSYTITLQGGENVIRFYYTNTVPKENTQVKVEHIYRAVELYNNPDGTKTLDGSTSTVYTAIEEQVWVGNTFTAVPLYSHTVGEGDAAVTHEDYKLDGDYPNVLTIDSLAAMPDGTQEIPNVITINYLRTTDSTPEQPPIDPPPGPSGPTYYYLTVNWVDEDGAALADQLRQSYSYGVSYTTEQKEIEGYTFAYMADGSDPASGRMNGNRTVTYVYTEAGEIEVPDVTPPLGPGPDPEAPTIEVPDATPPLGPGPDDGIIEIAEPPVPMGDAPVTGDDSQLASLLLTMLLSAGALCVLVVMDRRDSKKNGRKAK